MNTYEFRCYVSVSVHVFVNENHAELVNENHAEFVHEVHSVNDVHPVLCIAAAIPLMLRNSSLRSDPPSSSRAS